MMRSAAVVLFALALILATLGGGYGFASPPAATSVVPMPRPARADQAIDAVRDGVASRGREDYATYCAPCHGLRGDGDGPLAEMLVPRPARHSDAASMNALSDAYLLRLLKDGGPAVRKSPLMGAWGKILSEERIRDVVAFMRTLVGQSGRKDS